MQCSKCGSPLKENVKFCPNCGASVGGTSSITEKDQRLLAFENALGQKYKILKKLGAGGFAEVYLGEHTQLGRKVAIKILHQMFAIEEAMVERFRRESKAAAKLSHPNIIDIYDVGDAEGIYYFVMKYIEGETLSRKMARDRRIAPAEAVHIIRQIADALAYAHANDVIHRDIKPANVMLDQFGKPVLMDFGIARVQFEGNLTKTGTLMGTPHYLPPEQPLGKPVDGRSDIYSLGILFYEMLAGRPPFHDENSVTLIFKHINEPPPQLSMMAPDLAPELCEVVHKMIEKAPEDRYQSGGEVTEALDQLSAIYPTPASAPRKSTPGTPRNTEQLLLLAKENLKQQKIDRAIEIYTTIVKRDPQNSFAQTAIEEVEKMLSDRISQHISKNEFGEAKIVLSQMQKLPIDQSKVLDWKARLEAAEQKHSKESEFQMHFQAARTALEHDNTTGAIERLTKALTVNPTNPEARQLLTQARAAYEQNRQKAEYENAFSEAEYYFQNHSFEQALVAIKKALDIQPDPNALELQNKINAALKEKAYKKLEQERLLVEVDQLCEKLNFDEALKMLQQTREKYPIIADSKIPVVERNRALYEKFLTGKTSFDKKKWQEASNAFSDFLQTPAPYDFQVFYELRKEAENLQKAGARESSAEGEASQDQKTNAEIEQQLRKADVLVRMGQLEEARSECMKLLEKYPEHALVIAKWNEIEDLISPQTRLHRKPSAEIPFLPDDAVSGKTVFVPSRPKGPALPPTSAEEGQPAELQNVAVQDPDPIPRSAPVPQQPKSPTAAVGGIAKSFPAEVGERRSAFPLGLVLGGLGVLAVAALLAILIWIPKTPVNTNETPQTDNPGRPVVTPPPAATPLSVSIDAQPWANIQISGGDLNSKISDTTPAVVQLPPGRYTVRFENPQLQSFTEVIEVNSGSTSFSYPFKQLDPQKLVDQLMQ
jgi:serine/threonine protein kinase